MKHIVFNGTHAVCVSPFRVCYSFAITVMHSDLLKGAVVTARELYAALLRECPHGRHFWKGTVALSQNEIVAM